MSTTEGPHTHAGDRPSAPRRPQRLGTIVSICLVGLLLVPVAVFASDRFRDVSSSSVFHDDIGALADAGVTQGCAEGDRFCPTREVTRGQMSGFLHRGLATTAFDKSEAALTDDGQGGMGGAPVTVTLDGAGAPRDGSGLAVLEGAVTVFTEQDVSGPCPCEAEARVYREGSGQHGPSMWSQLPGEAANGAEGMTSVALPVSWTVPHDAGASGDYSVAVYVNGSQPAGARAEATLSATLVPFGEAG